MQAPHESVSYKDPDRPYLSIVVTARNDDHGGNLLGRMQVFVDAWINQAKRHQLSSELILVEWNPPVERERLSTALRWPRDSGPCQVRIIEVPPEVHARFSHVPLPLYQMIGKNVGIRRARGEFILATNIDVVFSSELVQFLASRRLEPGRLYRIDRTDVMSDVPVEGTLDEQLAYCRSHWIRLCAREGTFRLTPDGLRQIEPQDITQPESGIHFGDGWFPVEWHDPAEPIRWIGDDAEVWARVPPGGGVMELELESGPGIECPPPMLRVFDSSGVQVAEFRVAGRTRIGLVIPPPSTTALQSFRLGTPDGGLPVTDDQRILNFRVLRCDWSRPKVANVAPVPWVRALRQGRPLLGRLLAARGKQHGFWPVFTAGPGICARALRLLRVRGGDIFEAGHGFWIGEGWFDLEHSGGEMFRWAAREARLAVRILNDRSTLAIIVEPGPEVGFRPFVLEVRTASGDVIARAPVNGLTLVEFPSPVPCGTIATLILSAEDAGPPVAGDGRQLSFRVFAFGTISGKEPVAAAAGEAHWMGVSFGSRPAQLEWPATPERQRQIADMGKSPMLHSNACGDFTLMSREHWFDVRGYAELLQYSMHLDSLLCYMAQFTGVREEVLRPPMRIYHIEHGIGSGWTPEGDHLLQARMRQKGIGFMSYEEVMWFVCRQRILHAPIILNLENWGLAELDLPEMEPWAAVSASRSSR